MFSRNEMTHRLERTQELLKREKVDSLFISGEENFQYFAGVSGTIGLHYSNSRPAVIVVPAQGDPIAVVSTVTGRIVGRAVNDLRTYDTTFGVSTELYVKALKDAGLRMNRVGIEKGLETRIGQPVGELMSIMKALRGVKFVDAASVIWELRGVKSDEEVGLMRKAADITGRARQKTFDQFRAGMTQRDVARLFCRHMFAEGADRVSFVHVGPTYETQFWLDLPVKKGDILYLDGGAYVWTHTIDYSRYAVVGKASDKLRRDFNLIVNVGNKMAEALRPGITCSQLWKVGINSIRDAGLNPVTEGRIGHGQGVCFTEPPSIASSDKTVLQQGSVISTEPIVTLGDNEILWENTHVVTEDGHEQLTLETDELREIG
jgi:Xaa-Pro aminopeptidase